MHDFAVKYSSVCSKAATTVCAFTVAVVTVAILVVAAVAAAVAIVAAAVAVACDFFSQGPNHAITTFSHRDRIA